jgi:endonuclease IV
MNKKNFANMNKNMNKKNFANMDKNDIRDITEVVHLPYLLNINAS